jgi:hypothetical protein
MRFTCSKEYAARGWEPYWYEGSPRTSIEGFSSIAVCVLGLNPYRKFYEALGASVIGEKTIERDGKPFVEIAYRWQDLSGFQCEPLRGA